MRKVFLSSMILAFATTSTFAANIIGSTLTTTVASTLTQDQCAVLVGPQNIPVSVIPALPNYCVNNMGLGFSNDQLAALTPDQSSSLSMDWLRLAGPAKQVALLSNASSDAVFRIFALKKLSANQITMVTPDQLYGLSPQQLGLLDQSYLQAMTEIQMDALRADQIAAALDKWTDQQMKNLTTVQISGLPSSQTPVFIDYYNVWTTDQVQALTPAQLDATPLDYYGYAWFKNKLKGLSDSQIATLTDRTVIQMAKANILGNLSNSQLTNLSVSAVKNLKNLKLLGGLSDAQIALLRSTD